MIENNLPQQQELSEEMQRLLLVARAFRLNPTPENETKFLEAETIVVALESTGENVTSIDSERHEDRWIEFYMQKKRKNYYRPYRFPFGRSRKSDEDVSNSS